MLWIHDRVLPSEWSVVEGSRTLKFKQPRQAPTVSWLKAFWAEVESGIWKQVIPEAFSNVLVVAVEGNQLASPSAYKKFNMLPADVDLTPHEKGVLVRLGCLIAADSRGSLVKVDRGVFPLLAALIGAAERKECSLESLVASRSDARVVRAAFARHLAANSGRIMKEMKSLSSSDSISWRSKLRRLKLFESIAGSFESASGMCAVSYRQLSAKTIPCAPTPDWETCLESVTGSLKSRSCNILKVFGTGKVAEEREALLSAARVLRTSHEKNFHVFLLYTVISQQLECWD